MKNKLLNILIVDDQEEYRDVLKIILEDEKNIIHSVTSAEEAINKIENANINYDLIITDMIMDGLTGLELLKNIKYNNKNIEVIIITGYGSIQNAVQAMKEGAFSYFIKSHNPDELIKEVEKIRQLKYFETHAEDNTEDKFEIEHMLETKSKLFKKVLEITKKAAKSNSNILILGESGVGKEVIAKHIFNISKKNSKKFIDVNCHSFSENLFESEVFGHEKGAFTGASERRIGRFELAHKGVLFLDEIGNISMNAQSKLLKAIENKRIERIGNSNPIDVEFRLITATNKNLKNEIKKGTFREDLFYRISTITIEIPPLRNRREDLESLIDYFIKKYSKELDKKIISMEDGVKEFLNKYDYPGNVRELKNIIERLVVLSEDNILRSCDLPIPLDVNYDNNEEVSMFDDEIIHLKEIRKEAELNYIKKVLKICDYNASKTAEKLGISRRQMFNKIAEYNLK